LGIVYEAWLICDNEDASKKFVAIENLIFGFELFMVADLCATHEEGLALLEFKKNYNEQWIIQRLGHLTLHRSEGMLAVLRRK